MNPVQTYVIAHPRRVAVVFMALAAWGAYCTFMGGMAAGGIAAHATYASEALGG